MNKAPDFETVLRRHAERYPMTRPQDFIKLACQAEYGPSHLLGDREAARRAFDEEWQKADNARVCQPVTEEIGPAFSRLHLAAARDAGLHPDDVFALFCRAAVPHGSEEGLLSKINTLSSLSADGVLPFSFYTMTEGLAGWMADGCPVPHHSDLYRDAYAPAYRVVTRPDALALPLIDRIRRAGRPIAVAVDGRCGAGKSTLAALLADVFGAAVIHMDDFFLPPDRRTPERLGEPGGNVDRERFCAEVLPHLKNGSFSYGVFDCHVGAVTARCTVPDAPVTVIEGSYALHPALRGAYDLTVFLDIDKTVQKERLVAREGENGFLPFRDRWIPLEERYFDACGVREAADLVIETD